MLSRKTKVAWLKIVHYAFHNDNKTALFFVADSSEITKLYDKLPSFAADKVTINLSNHTVIFPNNSKIIIRTPSITVEKIRGLKIDTFEDFGLINPEIYQELLTRKNP